MIEVDVGDDRLAVVDAEKNEVVIRTGGWEPTATAPRLDRRVDEAVSGATRWLEFPESAVTIETAGEERWQTFTEEVGSMVLCEGSHVIQIDSNISIFVAFYGSGRLSREGIFGPVKLEFVGLTSLTLGFRSTINQPRSTITVPKTLEGAASALRYLATAITVDTPDKSYPSLRIHPPRVVFGDTLDIPRDIYSQMNFSDVSVSIPRNLSSLFVAAPIVYYLQADVSLEKDGPVIIDAPSFSAPTKLGIRQSLEEDVADLLHRVFFLDCLVRNAGPYGADLEEMSVLHRLDLDPEALYSMPTGARLSRYLDTQYELVRDELPMWHLGTIIEPTYDHFRALPHLLDRLSIVQLPRPIPIERKQLVAESVAQAYHPKERSQSTGESFQLVRNETRFSRIQGWLSSGIPVDAFHVTLRAFENRFQYHEKSDGPRSVLVVINDDLMLDEREAVETIYRERAEELSIVVSVDTSLTCEELSDRLQSQVDFLHYIGHCDEDGIRCVDGTLSVADIDRTRVKTFFLNACNSFGQGVELIEKGSVAGAVTLHDVINPIASIVGTEFARLVMHGFEIQLAMDLASRHSLAGKFYSVVGDGTYCMTQGNDQHASITDIKYDSGSDKYTIITESVSLSKPGSIFHSKYDVEKPMRLFGNPMSFNLDSNEIQKYLAIANTPVQFDNMLFWTTELMDSFSDELST